MLNKKRGNFSVPSMIVFVTLGIYVATMCVYFLSTFSLPLVSSSLLFSALLYIFAHFIRALRLWLLLSTTNISFRKTFFFNVAGDVIGGVFNKAVGEFSKVILYIKSGNPRIITIIFALLYARFFDFLFFLSFAFLVLQHPPEVDSSLVSFLMLVTLLLWITITIIPHICSIGVSYFAKNKHTKLSVQIIKSLMHIKNTYATMRFSHPSTFLMTLSLTIIIWLLEILALLLATNALLPLHIPHFVRAFLTTFQELFSHLFLGDVVSMQLLQTYHTLYFFLFLTSLLFLPHYLKNLTSRS